VYITTGAGATEALTDSKITGIIDDIRPLLRKEAYDEAVEQVRRTGPFWKHFVGVDTMVAKIL